MIWLYCERICILAHIPLQVGKGLDVKAIHLLDHRKEDASKYLCIVAGSVVIEVTKIIILCQNIKLVFFQLIPVRILRLPFPIRR